MKDPSEMGFSRFWDIYVPLTMSAIPAGFFKLLGMLIEGDARPQGKIETWQIVLLIIFQTCGIIGMAVVVLLRMEMGMRQLSVLSAEFPPFWRRLCLFVSLGFLTLFDLFLNVGMAFRGGWPLIIPAVIWYLFYVIGIRLAFRQLRKSA